MDKFIKKTRTKEGIELDEVDMKKMYAYIDEKIYYKLINKEIYILNQGSKSNKEFEKEFWKLFKFYKKKINKLIRKFYRFYGDETRFIYDFELILTEMEYIRLVSSKWVQEQRERLYRELNSPAEFKSWIDEGMLRSSEYIDNKKDYIKKKIDNFKK